MMNILSYLKKIPEFTDANFKKASYICGGILSAIVLFFIFEMFTVADFGISIEWNIFESKWSSILFPIGFVLAIINWGKFGHWSMQAYDVYKDSSGKKYVKENNDIGEFMFNSIVMPIAGHFVIEPILYACLIYYPLMCVFALLDVILPYVIALLLIVLAIGVLVSGRCFMHMRYRSLAIVCITFFVGGGLLWASINMHQYRTLQTVVAEPTSSGEDMFEEGQETKGKEQSETETVEIDEMFKDVD